MRELSLSEYINLNRKISKKKDHKLVKKVKIALVGSFTLNGFKETLNVKCRQAGICASLYVHDYNQYVQALADRTSRLYKFRPDITFLIVDAASLFGEIYYDPYSVSAQKRRAAVEYNYRKLRGLVANFVKNCPGILVLNNFEVPVYSPIGLLETAEKFGYLDMVRELNSRIKDFRKLNSVFVFDYDSFTAGIGKASAADDKMKYVADMKLSPGAIPLLCEEYMRYVRALKALTKKCIVLDMDNTLWGGIVGEDGLEGIRLGPTPPGNAYVDFQRQLLALFRRGIILAVNSTNNRNDVVMVLREHPHMVLKERHFASIKINWESKIKNLVEIARELNLGLNGMIFLDDDERVRAMVREALPQVSCPDLPEDAGLYARFISEMKDLDSLQITREDKKRSRYYIAERKRKESAAAFGDISKYLEHLDIRVAIEPATRFSIPRLSQLTLRTNQFNFSTRRYSEKDIEAFVNKPEGYRVYHVDIKDKYGDYGITGALIIRTDALRWLVDTFLLSCRVLGRSIEDAVLAYLIKAACRNGAARVDIAYRKTDKNAPVLEFLKKHGIGCGAKDSVVNVYDKTRHKQVCFPKHIKVISKC